MNPFVRALYDEPSFCPGGCGACIQSLRDIMRRYDTEDTFNVWQILSELEPHEVVHAPHWDQRLRHLLIRAYPNPAETELVIRGWLVTSMEYALSLSHVEFIDFLVWDICHKTLELYPRVVLDELLLEAVMGRATTIAVALGSSFFGLPEFDSLAESLLIVRNEDGIYVEGLDLLLALPWSEHSRTGTVLKNQTMRYSEIHRRQRMSDNPDSRISAWWRRTGRVFQPR